MATRMLEGPLALLEWPYHNHSVSPVTCEERQDPSMAK